MRIVKTLGLVLLTAFIVAFVMLNYGEKYDVIIWPTSNDALVFNWPVGVIALVFWLLGVVPMWLYNRSVQWGLNRRIRSLENSIKSSAMAARRKSEEMAIDESNNHLNAIEEKSE
jgi:hypothetical protein